MPTQITLLLMKRKSEDIESRQGFMIFKSHKFEERPTMKSNSACVLGSASIAPSALQYSMASAQSAPLKESM